MIIEKFQGKYGLITKINSTDYIRTDYRNKIVLEIKMPDGSYKSKTYEGENAYENAFDAVKIAAEFKKNYIPPQNMTSFADYSKNILQKATDFKENTRQRYLSVLENHILPSALFNNDVGNISRGDAKEFLRGLVATKSEGTAELAHVIMCRIFDEAVEDGIIDINPAKNLHKRVFKERKKDKDKFKADPFTVDQLDLFLKTAPSVCDPLLCLLFETLSSSGMRLGEGQALRVSCFDFENFTVHITEQYIKNDHSFGGPKLSSRRTIHMPGFMMEKIKAFICAKQLENSDLLFVDPKTSLPISQRKIDYRFKKICRKAGLKKRRVHDLRHTYATILLLANTSPAFVQYQLGHASIKTTIDIYCHWIPAEGRIDIEKALSGKKTEPEPNCGS
jgi:integrase